MSKTSESMSSIIGELEKEIETEEEEEEVTVSSRQKEKRVADSWQQIHGAGDWVGMVDPIDPLLRSELIRYGEIEEEVTVSSRQKEKRVADSWQQIHGAGDWVGMVDPIDPLLRSELIRYGEIEEVTVSSRQKEKRVADSWQKIHGAGDWAGMVDPIDPLLRSELIRYGEMAQACYDAFDSNPFSNNCGFCRFTSSEFFKSLGMIKHGYEVTRYLYATSNINLPHLHKKLIVGSQKSNWIGYVAVSNEKTSRNLGRRDITIALRGTVTKLEWFVDFMDFLKPISSCKYSEEDPTVKVESGFFHLYADKNKNCKYSAKDQILTEVNRLKEMYPNEEMSITITGHSLGSALAILSAYDIAGTGRVPMESKRAIRVCIFSFSGPRVGNVRFKERLESLGVKVLRVFNVHDLVPKLPGLFFNEQVPPVLMKLVEWLPWSYSHVGVELELDHKNSPLLKETSDLGCAHNLEAHLHLLDGYHGKGHRFELVSGRDRALVNKASDFLKDHYLVPPYWRQDENKGMVRNKDGRWMQPERPKFDDHPENMCTTSSSN